MWIRTFVLTFVICTSAQRWKYGAATSELERRIRRLEKRVDGFEARAYNELEQMIAGPQKTFHKEPMISHKVPKKMSNVLEDKSYKKEAMNELEQMIKILQSNNHKKSMISYEAPKTESISHEAPKKEINSKMIELEQMIKDLEKTLPKEPMISHEAPKKENAQMIKGLKTLHKEPMINDAGNSEIIELEKMIEDLKKILHKEPMISHEAPKIQSMLGHEAPMNEKMIEILNEARISDESSKIKRNELLGSLKNEIRSIESSLESHEAPKIQSMLGKKQSEEPEIKRNELLESLKNEIRSIESSLEKLGKAINKA